MTAKIDLSDLFELFAKTEELLPVAPPVSPEARKWRRVFADNVAAFLGVRADSIGARKVAYENTLTAFLDATHPNADQNRCAHCGGPEAPDAVLKPIGWSVRHAWLHDDCWAPWREACRNAATAELAAAGVVRP